MNDQDSKEWELDDIKEYKNLVAKAKEVWCARVRNGSYKNKTIRFTACETWCSDMCNEINLWTYWQGYGLTDFSDVKIMLVGQDWGNEDTERDAVNRIKEMWENKRDFYYDKKDKEFQNSVVENRIHKDGRTYLEIYKTDEYFRIHTVGWNGRYESLDAKESKQIGLNRHLWDLKIAVEHENNKADWLDELIKLVHIRCPLKVVIGYNYCDQREEAGKKKLIYAAKCMQMVEAFHPLDQEEYLIVLGNGAPKDKKHETYHCFDYRAYLYDDRNKGFERLK